ncbi:hypothetical protein PR048_023962 [Dryococelus australis]|uniref:Uncharacterized protein n=1 Tax=Dryococelus australis TaxID=614101 RepID=A0ABQ9GVQ8_9NEOP|nr:hypothetical protein PR048_023962 [Dryococelus australis]
MPPLRASNIVESPFIVPHSAHETSGLIVRQRNTKRCLGVRFQGNGAADVVVVRLLASQLGEPGSIPAGSRPDFRMFGNLAGRCRWFGGFSQGFPSPHANSFRRYSILTSRPRHYESPKSLPYVVCQRNNPLLRGKASILTVDHAITFPKCELRKQTRRGGSNMSRWLADPRKYRFPASLWRWGLCTVTAFHEGAAVAERIACSPPTIASQVQSPAGSLPDFRMWESYRTMPLVGGFSRGSPVSQALSFRRCSILTSITLIASQYLAVENSPNLFTHSIMKAISTLDVAQSRTSHLVARAEVLCRGRGGSQAPEMVETPSVPRLSPVSMLITPLPHSLPLEGHQLLDPMSATRYQPFGHDLPCSGQDIVFPLITKHIADNRFTFIEKICLRDKTENTGHYNVSSGSTVVLAHTLLHFTSVAPVNLSPVAYDPKTSTHQESTESSQPSLELAQQSTSGLDCLLAACELKRTSDETEELQVRVQKYQGTGGRAADGRESDLLGERYAGGHVSVTESERPIIKDAAAHTDKLIAARPSLTPRSSYFSIYHTTLPTSSVNTTCRPLRGEWSKAESLASHATLSVSRVIPERQGTTAAICEIASASLCAVKRGTDLRDCGLDAYLGRATFSSSLRDYVGAAVRTLASPTKTNRVRFPAGPLPDFCTWGIMLDDAAGGRVFSGISNFPRSCIPALLRFHLVSTLSTLLTQLLRAAQAAKCRGLQPPSTGQNTCSAHRELPRRSALGVSHSTSRLDYDRVPFQSGLVGRGDRAARLVSVLSGAASGRRMLIPSKGWWRWPGPDKKPTPRERPLRLS